MVNKRIVLILLTILLSFNFVLAFGIEYGHPQLTEEIVKYYNYFANRKISQEELELIKIGSIQEDFWPRWVNHFYNPFDGSGINWNLFKGSKFWLKTFLLSLPYKDLPSTNWAKNEFVQEKYQLNRTYQFAIRSYFENKKEAFLALGHLLHLLEDLGVPDHVRGDPHSGQVGDNLSSFEEYSKEVIKNNGLNVADKLIKEYIQPYSCKDLESCFQGLASFTANNWFSEDTIGMYDKPKIVKFENIDKYSVLYYSENKPILLKYFDVEKRKDLQTTDHEKITNTWFSVITPEIIRYGAGLLNLYFSEIEEIERNEVLLMNYQFERRRVNILNFFANLTFDTLLSHLKNSSWRVTETTIKTALNLKNELTSFVKTENQINNLDKTRQNQITATSLPELSETELEKPTTYYEERREVVMINKESNSKEQEITNQQLIQQTNIPKDEQSIQQEITKEKQKDIIKEQATTSEEENTFTENKILENEEIKPIIIGGGGTPRDPCDNYKNKNYPKIIINEIQFETATETKDEFIELYNPNNEEIDLTCWFLEKYASKQSPTSTPTLTTLIPASKFNGKIKPNSFFLIAHDSVKEKYQADLTYPQSYSISKNNVIILKKPNGEISDLVGYGDNQEKIYQYENNPFIAGNFQNKSIQRKNFLDTDDNSKDFWLKRPTPQNSSLTQKPRDDFVDLTELTLEEFNATTTINEEGIFLNISFKEPQLNVSSTNYLYDLIISTSTDFNTFKLEDFGVTSSIPQPKFDSSKRELNFEITKCPAENNIYYLGLYLKDLLDEENKSKLATTSIELPEDFCRKEEIEESKTSTTTAKILFSEIRVLIGTSTGEFIELYNPNEFEVDLTRWRIERKLSSGKYQTIVPKSKFQNKTIKPYSYFLLVNANTVFNTSSKDVTDKIEILSQENYRTKKLNIKFKPKENIILGGLRVITDTLGPGAFKDELLRSGINVYQNDNFIRKANILEYAYIDRICSESKCDRYILDFYFESGLALNKNEIYTMTSQAINWSMEELSVRSFYQITPEIIYGASYDLAKNNGLELYNPNNVLIDSFEWQEVDNQKSFNRRKTASSTEETILNENLGNAYDTDNNSDFILTIPNPENSSTTKPTIKEIKDFKVEIENNLYKFSWFSPALYDKDLRYELRYSLRFSDQGFENASSTDGIGTSTLPEFNLLSNQSASLDICSLNTEFPEDTYFNFYLGILKGNELLKLAKATIKAIDCKDISGNFVSTDNGLKVSRDLNLEELIILNFNQCPTVCRANSQFTSLTTKITKLISTTTEIQISTTTYVTTTISTTTEDGTSTTAEIVIPTTTIITQTISTTTEIEFFSTSTFEQIGDRGCQREGGLDVNCNGPESGPIWHYFYLYRVPVGIELKQEDIIKIYADYRETHMIDDGWWVFKFRGSLVK